MLIGWLSVTYSIMDLCGPVIEAYVRPSFEAAILGAEAANMDESAGPQMDGFIDRVISGTPILRLRLRHVLGVVRKMAVARAPVIFNAANKDERLTPDESVIKELVRVFE